MNEWDRFDWLYDAKRLLNWRTMTGTEPLMLVIRHSHREESDNARDLLKLRLTSIGKRIAFSFGKLLPEKDRVDVYYSSHPRCVETAEEIVNGYNSVRNGAMLTSDIRVLLGPQGSGDRIGDEMISLGGPEFVKRWIDGKLSLETIEPIDEFGTVFKIETFSKLETALTDTMQIHVTHDLVLMGARNVLFRTIPSSENWTPFLGGFGVVRKGNQFIGHEMGIELILE